MFLRHPGREPIVPHRSDNGLWIRQALQRLPAKDQEVLMLREYDELSYAEIAAVLKMRLNTVRSKLFRARQALRKVLLSEKKANLPDKVGVQEEET